MATTIQLRRDSEANWINANPVLNTGEVGVSTDTSPLAFKVGTGLVPWSSLPYFLAADDANTSSGASWSSTQTTAYVTDSIQEKRRPIVPISADYQLTSADNLKTLMCDDATGLTITVPLESTEDLFTGFSVDLVQVNTGQVTVEGEVGVTINTPETLLTQKQWATVSLLKTGTDTWLLSGNIDPV